MTIKKIRAWLDYIPLAILTILSIIAIYECFSVGYELHWQHFLGFFTLLINYAAFYIHHKIGVVTTGIIILLGIIGLIQVSTGIRTSGFTFFKTITIPFGDSRFFLWLLIHLIFSARYYFAVLTKQYWDDILVSIQSRKQ